jgi:hypothetical protein
MELDHVAAKSLGVESPKPGRVLVGEPRLVEHVGRAPAAAELGQRRRLPGRPVRRNGVAQRAVASEQVDVLVGRRLVEHVVGLYHLLKIFSCCFDGVRHNLLYCCSDYWPFVPLVSRRWPLGPMA